MATPGGPGSIAEQEVDHGVDVLLGGGRQRFQQSIAGGPDADKTVIESAQRQGHTVVKALSTKVGPSGRAYAFSLYASVWLRRATGTPANRAGIGRLSRIRRTPVSAATRCCHSPAARAENA